MKTVLLALVCLGSISCQPYLEKELQSKWHFIPLKGLGFMDNYLQKKVVCFTLQGRVKTIVHCSVVMESVLWCPPVSLAF